MTILLKPLWGGRPVVIDKPIVLVGRHADCDLIITDSPKISRKHCCLALVNSRFVVRDLDSMNGVWVNQDRVEKSSDLNAGDELMIGDVPFVVVKMGSPQQAKSESINLPATFDASDDPLPRPQMDRARVMDDDAKSVDIRWAPGDGKIEFSGAMALPTESPEDDFVVPLGDIED